MSRVLKRIQEQANKKYPNIMKPVDNSDILKVFDEMLERDLPNWKRKYYEAMRKHFDKQEMEVDEEVAKKRDEYVTKKIKKAIADGRLEEPKYVQTTKTTSVDDEVQKGKA